MDGERETPREIARGGPRLARTCLVGPPSFGRGSHACVPNTLSYSLHTRLLAPRACGCTLSHRSKVFVPCNEPPPPGFPPPTPHFAVTATDRRRSGVPEQTRGARRAPGEERIDDSTYYTFVRAPRRRWGWQAGIAVVAHG